MQEVDFYEVNPLKNYEKLIGNFVSDIIGIQLKNFKIDSFDRFIIDPNNVLEFPISLNESIKNDKICFFFSYTFYDFPNDNQTIKNLIKFYEIKYPTINAIKIKKIFSVYLNKNIDSKSIFNIFFPVKVKDVLVEDYIMIEERPYLLSEVDEFSEILQNDLLKEFQLEINFKDNNEDFDKKLKILEIITI